MRRIGQVMLLEARMNLRRPPTWVLLAAVVFLAWIHSGIELESGDSSIGGVRPFVNSEFAVARWAPFFVLCTYSLFAALAGGMALIRDDESGMVDLLMSTPLRPAEYLSGKFLGVFLVFVGILGAHMLMLIVFCHGAPLEPEVQGPLVWMNFLRPFVLLCLPLILFLVALPFAIGCITRQPVLVYFFPIFALASALAAVGTESGWLPPFWDMTLTIADPSALRWMETIWFDIDRGVGFYNSAPMQFDGLFFANRAFLLLASLASLVWAQRSFSASLRQPGRPRKVGLLTRKRQLGPAPSGEELEGLSRRAPVGVTKGSFWVAGAELRAFMSHPGFYLGGFMIVFLTVSAAAEVQGPFGGPVLLTSGLMAMGARIVFMALTLGFLTFFTTESLQREFSVGMSSIFYSTPLPGAAVLIGKVGANCLAAFLLACAAVGGCWLLFLGQPQSPGASSTFPLWPFALSWGLLPFPTFLAWTSFVALLQAFGRNRYWTYSISFAVLFLSIYLWFTGVTDWATDWLLLSELHWTDMGALQLNRSMVVWNRVACLLLGAALALAAVRFLRRRERDRLAPRPPRWRVGWAGSAAALLVVPSLLIGGMLYFEGLNGFQGRWTRDGANEYWRRNWATYRDEIEPRIKAVELDVHIEPEKGWFSVKGTYRLVNAHPQPLRQITMTPGDWNHLRWSLDGDPFQPQDRSGLAVFSLPQVLQPGEEAVIGFSYNGTVPRGASRRGGGTMHFILPSGVVLDNFTPDFVPMVGFQEHIGVPADHRYEPRDYPDDFYKAALAPHDRRASLFTTRISITGPAEYTFNSVGVLESTSLEDGRRTAVWVSDYPVRSFNVIGGRWKVARKEGAAVFHHPGHTSNVEDMLEAMVAARRYYSEWFHPFPWKEMKLSEFPGLATYARGFATNVAFSEKSGFIVRRDPRWNTAFVMAAHEASHQWWGHLLTPGVGPGGAILVEGMANFSTTMLAGQVRGIRDRIEFCKRREESYARRRSVDSERPLVRTTGRRRGDGGVIYDKSAWVFWIMLNHVGREPMLRGLRDFIGRYKDGPDYPALQDLIDTMRGHAEDPEAFDEFVGQWFFDVVIPSYSFSDVEVQNDGGRWVVTALLTNHGSGLMPVEVAMTAGERFTSEGDLSESYSEERTKLLPEPGQSLRLSLSADFKPEVLVVDPDALVLQLERGKAVYHF